MIHRFTRTHSRISTILVAFDAGSRSEGKDYNPGIAHMLEHSIFKGTKTRDCTSLNREIAFLGGSVNASTSHELVNYYISAPVENIDKCMEILSDMVFNSTFPEEEFLKEREVVKEEEISSNDSPDAYIWKNFSENFFTNYIATPIIGTQESISKFSRDEISRFHNEFYGREAAVVSLCSNMSKSDAKKLMNKHFGKASGKLPKRRVFEMTSHHPGKTLEITKPGIEHTYVFMGTPYSEALGVRHPVSSVMNTILSSGMDSRLFTEVREKRGLVYGISSLYATFQCGGAYIFDFSTRDKNVEEAISVVKDEIDRISSHLVTSEELERAKNKLRASFYSANESSGTLAGWAVTESLFGQTSIDDYIERVSMVTEEEIMAMAKSSFDMSKLLTVICRKE